MDAAKLFQRWQRRLAKLRALLPELLRNSRTEGAPEQIHQLRVVLRRMRMLARFGQPVLGKLAVKEFNDWSRRVLDNVGPVRDYDVMLEWLKKRPDAHAELERQRARRIRLWKSRRGILKPPKRHLLSQISPGAAEHQHKARFRKDYLKQGERLHRKAAAAAPRYFDLSLVQRHEFRRVIRRWRYWRELSLAQRKLPRDPIFKQLVRLQDTLGEYQNRVVAERILTRHHADPDGKLHRALLEEQDRVQQRIRRPLTSVTRLA